MIRQLSIILLLAFSSGLYAQKADTLRKQSIQPDTVKTQRFIQSDTVKTQMFIQSDTVKTQMFIQSDTVETQGFQAEEVQSDSLPKRRIQADTMKKTRILREWGLSADFSEEVPLPVDTVFSLSNRYRNADLYSPVNAMLGNYGLPFYQINFFDRVRDPDKFLYSYFYPLMYVADRAVFMNTQAPFTEMKWSFAGPRETAEQTFRVRHSQNVNRFWNFGLIYDIVYSLGQYNYQRAEDKAFIFHSSYTGVKYKLYFAAGLNSMKDFENGGIINREDLGTMDTRDIPVHLGGLNNAISLLRNRNLLLVQRYTIGNEKVIKKDTLSPAKKGFAGLSGTFSHIFQIEGNRRTYTDKYPGAGFYDSIYINAKSTFDSLSMRSIKNTVRFDFTTDTTRKFRLGGGVGLRNETYRYSQIRPLPDTLSADTVGWKRSNNALVGRLYNNIGDKFSWAATGELYLTGYRAGDFTLNGQIIKGFNWKKGRASWIFSGSMSNTQPSIWYGQWAGNNFKWSANMDKELRVDLGSAFTYPARKMDLRVNYAVINNYTDFDSLALPSQYSGALSIAALTMRKEFRAWKFHFSLDAIVQQSSNTSVLDLPLATLRSALFFEHLFVFSKTGGDLNTQLGADVTYNTKYHPYAYMPATGRFYRQEEAYAGNYPFINVFFNFKVKRTRVFIMLDHANAGLMEKNYEMVPGYPMNIRMLRYGLGWTFYN